jgi:uncharacterized protein
MFIDFFYLLRKRGLKVSINEWMSLIDALDQGLAKSSLISFYYLCRAVLIKSESDYDKFDMAFAEYFKGIKSVEEIPDEIWQWLEKEVKIPENLQQFMANAQSFDFEELQKMLEDRLKNQHEEHNGGSQWIGTGGTSPFGHGGYNPAGIRIGGQSTHRSAVQVAGERNFKDFRNDNMLDIRNFQMAFRKLRQFSSKIDGAKTELNIDNTIQKTCDNAGRLELVFDRPRKNTVKVLILFDSDGSMLPYSQLCSRLFQAAHQSNHFKDLKVYYFHNCVYEHLYTGPACRRGEWIDTEWVFKNLDEEYKVIFIGDAAMASSELLSVGGNNSRSLWNDEPGIKWLQRFKTKYKKCVWLNPIPERDWHYTYGNYTIEIIGQLLPMYELSIDGLDAAIKKLLVSR